MSVTGRDPDSTLIGRTIAGKFAIESVIAGGAMGAVFRARQVALDKAVAIKVMHRELSRDPSYVARFLREAKAASRIDHPNSVRVIDFGEEPDGLLYLAMELLDGRDLYTLIRQDGPLDALRIGEIVMQVLAAMAAAHEMGVVHRDIKPENIMIARGTDDEGRSRDLVKVCDFGVAKITDRRDEKVPTPGPAITTEGLVVGTPEYMSPEQGRGEPLDARSDLYSVGVILYQMLTGKVPFEADSALGIVLKHVTEEPVPPSFVRAGVDPKLEAVCIRAMAKNRDARYQTAREMRADVRAAIATRSVSALEAVTIAAADASVRPPPAASPPAPVAAPAPALPAARPDPTPRVDGPVATADTAVAFDSTAIRAVSPPMPNDPVPLAAAGVPRTRWAGIALGGVLLAAALGAVGLTLKNVKTANPASSARSITTTTTTTSVAPSKTAVAPTPAPSETAAPAPVASIERHDTKTPRTTTSHATSAHSAAAALGDAGPASSASASAAPTTASGHFDPKAAKVSVTGVRAIGVPPDALRAVVSEPALLKCYRSALTGVGAKPPPSTMVLHVDANDEGKIQTVNLNGAPPIPPKAGQCVMKSLAGKQVTSEGAFLVSGDVDLVFSVD